MKEIGILGGGIAGLLSAFFLLEKGYKITLLEKDIPGAGATTRAAGMLAPVNELEFGELEVLNAGLASRALWSDLIPRLGDIGLIEAGTIDIALEEDDLQYLKRLFEYQRNHQLEAIWLNSTEVNLREPYLNRQIPAGIFAPDDVQVDPLKLIRSLQKRILEMGGRILHHCTVESWKQEENVSVRVAGGEVFRFDKWVVAGGVSQGMMDQLPYKIYPVRGEMISLEKPPGFQLDHTIRIRNKTLGNGYIVPKEDRILVGATSEEKGLDSRNTAGGILDILRRAYAAVPGIYELPIIETWAGLRPGTLSRKPVIDREGETQIYHLNGLYRHGILLGPIAAMGLVELMESGNRIEPIRGFTIPEF